MDKQAALFDRQRFQGLAYRITGSMSDAEDIVQDAWLRWQSRDESAVRDAQSYIARIVTNLSLDRLRAKQKERDTYVGSWLPEPNVEHYLISEDATPEQSVQLADDISVAFLLALESLSAAERVAFILHDVFGYTFDEVSEILGRDATSCRQLASRARKALKQGKKRYVADVEDGKDLANAFQLAISHGDVSRLTALLTDRVTFISDGGGKVAAVPRPVSGADTVAKMLVGFAQLYRDADDVHATFAQINHLPGFVVTQGRRVIQTVALEIDERDLIDRIYVVRNPDKLRHLAAQN